MSFFNELKRRNVFRVGIAYAVATWVLIQIADILLDNFGAPPWVMKSLVVALAVGFFISLFFAWAYEMTADGVKRESEVDRSQSMTQQTGQKLNFVIISLLVIALGYFVWESRFASEQDKGSEPFTQETTEEKTEAGGERSDLAPRSAGEDGSIAVLPFANRSNQEEDLFFTDGIHDDLLTQLAKIDDLKVISRTSVMKYRGSEKTIPEIATELGVSTILEGGIQRAGKRIRINAQLIDVVTDEHLWAETFDREMTMENIFDIQTEITRQIVTAVKGELSDTEQQALAAQPTTNLEAYEAYLHATAAIRRAEYSKEKYLDAQPWAERAVQLDPNFAEAWAVLAEIHAQAVWQNYDNTPERHLAAREALDQAVKLSPESASVIAAQADYLYRFENNYQAALATYQKAAEVAPGDARVLLYTAITLRRLGEWEESISVFEESLALDPSNLFTATQMTETLTFMNEWERLENLISEWIIQYPDSNELKANQLQAKLYYHGDLQSARRIFDLLKPWPGVMYTIPANDLYAYERDFDGWLAIQDLPEFTQFRQFGTDFGMTRGIIYHLMGDEEQSRQLLQQQIDYHLAQQPTGTLRDAFVSSNLAVCWSYLGEHEKALESSQKAIEMIPMEKDHIFGMFLRRTHTMLLARAGKRDEALEILAANVDKKEGLTRWQLYLDPRWDFFRDDERFNELIRPLDLEETGQ